MCILIIIIYNYISDYINRQTHKRPSCRRRRRRRCRNLWSDIAQKWPLPMNESSEWMQCGMPRPMGIVTLIVPPWPLLPTKLKQDPLACIECLHPTHLPHLSHWSPWTRSIITWTCILFSFVSHFIHWISMDQRLGRSTASPALWAFAKGAWPYMPTLYVLYLTMSPLIAIACLVFNIVAVIYIKYRHLLARQ